MTSKIISLLLGVLLLSSNVYAQEYLDEDLSDCPPMEVVHDTIHDTVYIHISNLDDVTKNFNMTFDDYVKHFLRYVDSVDVEKKLSPERIYLNYFLPLLENKPDWMRKRYIVKNYRPEIHSDSVSLRSDELSYPDSSMLHTMQLDVMLSCHGDEQTSQFLKSPKYIAACLEQLFSDIYYSKQTIKGINLYFPDFSFKEKRAMAQLVKSVSLVVDSSRLKSIRGLRLYVSFDLQAGLAQRSYLLSLAPMVDSILLVDRTTEKSAFPEMLVITAKDADDNTVFSKILNQFYLLRYFMDPFPQTDSELFFASDVQALIGSDYADNNWEQYFWILVGLLGFALIVLLLYRFVPSLSYYFNKNIDYCFTIIIILILEVFFLLMTMVEAMSRENVFNFTGKNKNMLLLMPLLFVFIIPLVKVIGRKRHIP